MAEIDELWHELHDLEARVAPLEADLIRRGTQAQDHRARAEQRRWLLTVVLTAVSTAALVLSLHPF